MGKTTIAFTIAEEKASIYLDVESRLGLQKVKDINTFPAEYRDKLIILDEVQRLPDVFDALWGIVDKERRKGNKADQFLF